MNYFYPVQQFTQIYLLLRETFPFRKYYQTNICVSLSILIRQIFYFYFKKPISFKYYSYVLLKIVLKKEHEVPDIHYSLHSTYLTLLLVQLWRENTLLYVA